MDEPTVAELRAVVGPRADYYLSAWSSGSPSRPNWAAFFLTGFWLAYRRMFRVTLVFAGVVAVVTLLQELIAGWLGYREAPAWVDRLVAFGLSGACAAGGNHWYRSHVERVIAKTRALGLPEEQHLQELARRGGRRLFRAVGLILLVLLAMAALLFGWVLVAIAWDVLRGNPPQY